MIYHDLSAGFDLSINQLECVKKLRSGIFLYDQAHLLELEKWRGMFFWFISIRPVFHGIRYVSKKDVFDRFLTKNCQKWPFLVIFRSKMPENAPILRRGVSHEKLVGLI